MSTLRWPINTSRLELRPYRSTDAMWIQHTYSQPAVYRFLPYGPFTPEEAEQKNNQRMAYTSLDDESGGLSLVVEYQKAPIGAVTMWLIDGHHDIAEIGWTMDPAYGGQGLATEAVVAALSVAFDFYGMHRMVARVDARNTPSINLALRAGMTQEGHLRQDFWNRGEWTDTRVFGILASDDSRPRCHFTPDPPGDTP